jgi:hypothetical protein
MSATVRSTAASGERLLSVPLKRDEREVCAIDHLLMITGVQSTPPPTTTWSVAAAGAS